MYDSKADTLEHIGKVRENISTIIACLLARANDHDRSKLDAPEKAVFDEWTPRLSGVTYGSDQYREMLNHMRPAIDHHQKNNRHHPEYFDDGILGMNLVDIVEMLCDWIAAAKRHDDGDVRRSIEINKDRFGMGNVLPAILLNTINYIESFKEDNNGYR